MAGIPGRIAGCMFNVITSYLRVSGKLLTFCLVCSYPLTFFMLHTFTDMPWPWLIAGTVIFGDGPGFLAAWIIGRIGR